MNNSELLSFLGLLSNYDRFIIQQAGKPPFHSTNINHFHGGVLEFERQFATPVYSEGVLTKITPINQTEFECQLGERLYTIYAMRKKPELLPTYKPKTWRNILSFAETKYINPKEIHYIKDIDLMVLVVDPHLLGELTPVEELQIRYFIDTYLRGQSDALQVCRTVYFGCKIHDSCQKIYAGIYDLEKLAPVNMTMVYNKQLSRSMAEIEVKKYLALLKMAMQHKQST